ncbi:hypothetical protein PEC18_02355 [Paucibacter sp. O1-1]|nr:hypothetical protein [Paucibacter sp. O1-1]MDA3824725.1 hypothetical protein [Paucibacter sp. O1-1]
MLEAVGLHIAGVQRRIGLDVVGELDDLGQAGGGEAQGDQLTQRGRSQRRLASATRAGDRRREGSKDGIGRLFDQRRDRPTKLYA